MATIPYSTDTDRGEAKFFFTMACVMATSIVAGFAFNLAIPLEVAGFGNVTVNVRFDGEAVPTRR